MSSKKEITQLVGIQLVQDPLGAPDMLVVLVVVQGHMMVEEYVNLVIVA